MDDLRSTNERNDCPECGFDWNSEPGDILPVLAGSPAALRKVAQRKSEDLIATKSQPAFLRPSNPLLQRQALAFVHSSEITGVESASEAPAKSAPYSLLLSGCHESQHHLLDLNRIQKQLHQTPTPGTL
jgi:hypothetical protein